jgi:hypothetical protein
MGLSHCRIEVFDQKPAAGLERFDHAPQRPVAIRQVAQDQPRVGEIERVAFEFVGGDVMPSELDVRVAGVDPARIDVSRDDMAVRCSEFCEPAGDRAVAGADLQGRPAVSHADTPGAGES